MYLHNMLSCIMSIQYKIGRCCLIESDLKEWIRINNVTNSTLIYSFSINDNDFVVKNNDFIEELEEVQMNIRSSLYPDNVCLLYTSPSPRDRS